MSSHGEPIGPFCQSCSMPLSKPEDFGTTAEGFRQNDYCIYCYNEGKFTHPDMTLDKMIDFCVKPTAESTGLSEEEARGMLEHTLPMLRRWRDTV